MYFPQYLTSSHSQGHPLKPLINQPGQITPLSALFGNDGALCARVHEGLQGHLVYLDVYVQHGHLHEVLRHEFLSVGTRILGKGITGFYRFVRLGFFVRLDVGCRG